MSRSLLLNSLLQYEQHWVRASPVVASWSIQDAEATFGAIHRFVIQEADCFERFNKRGHVTGSCLIVSESGEILLTFHRKLQKWLQLGGHCDGDPCVWKTALREGEEESGLTDLKFLDGQLNICTSEIPEIFDLDVHTIPARKDEPEHLHFDVRYLLITSQPQSIVQSDESSDLKWFSLVEARTITSEPSMLRQFDKFEAIHSRQRYKL